MRPLDEVETLAYNIVRKNQGCTNADLKIFLGRTSVYDMLRISLRRGKIIAKKLPGENETRYYTSGYAAGRRQFKKAEPKLSHAQRVIIRVIKGNPGRTGRELNLIMPGGLLVGHPWHLPALVRRGLIRKENIPGKSCCYYYPV